MGHLRLVSSTDGELIKDFGRVHDHQITGIIVTEDQKFFYTSSDDGVLKQWNYQDNTLAKDYGEILNYIWSLCL
jgi:WD40 repeat protein